MRVQSLSAYLRCYFGCANRAQRRIQGASRSHVAHPLSPCTLSCLWLWLRYCIGTVVDLQVSVVIELDHCGGNTDRHTDINAGMDTCLDMVSGMRSAPRPRTIPIMAAERLVPLPCAQPVKVQLQQKSLAIVHAMSEMFGTKNFETCQEEAAAQVLDSTTGEVGARAGLAQRRA